jgi:hypothetical protein
MNRSAVVCRSWLGVSVAGPQGSIIRSFDHSTIQPFNHSTIQPFNHSITPSLHHSPGYVVGLLRELEKILVEIINW